MFYKLIYIYLEAYWVIYGSVHLIILFLLYQTGVRLVAACPIQKPLSQFPWFATQSCINNHVDTSDPCSCSVDLTLHQSYVARRDETWHDYAGLHAVSEGGLMQHRDLQRRTLLLCRRRAYITGGFNVPYM